MQPAHGGVGVPETTIYEMQCSSERMDTGTKIVRSHPPDSTAPVRDALGDNALDLNGPLLCHALCHEAQAVFQKVRRGKLVDCVASCLVEWYEI